MYTIVTGKNFGKGSPIYENTHQKCETEPEICKMKVLLTAATAMEIAPAIEALTQSGFIQGNNEVDVLITGLGQVTTTWMLTNAIHTQQPHWVIQAGIAGAFDTQQLPLGSVVYVQQDAFGDLGMEENGLFTSIFDNGFADANKPPFTNGWLVNDSPVLNGLAIEPATAVTVNKISDSALLKQQLIDKFNPGIETMEGAAFHYVCLKAGLPFLQLRAISNMVGIRDKSKWQLPEAVEHLNQQLLLLLSASIK
jgi:futalosine hydrolase